MHWDLLMEPNCKHQVNQMLRRNSLLQKEMARYQRDSQNIFTKIEVQRKSDLVRVWMAFKVFVGDITKFRFKINDFVLY